MASINSKTSIPILVLVSVMAAFATGYNLNVVITIFIYFILLQIFTV